LNAAGDTENSHDSLDARDGRRDTKSKTYILHDVMTLKEIAELVKAQATGPLDLPVADITCDSRQVTPGSIFAAIHGLKEDGHAFIPEAIDSGAVAVLSERACLQNFSRTWLQVRDVRRALAEAAAALFGFPSRSLKLVGVTGTNGKTTTTYLIDSLLEASGETSARMGTTTYKIGNEEVPAERTTPEAPEIQRFLRAACEARCGYAIMEVSSHALELKRVYGCEFAVAVFTNLTRDHLDFHGTMEAYFAAKRKLFEGVTGKAPNTAIVNLDDPHAEEIIRASKGKVVSYGLDHRADVSAEAVRFSLTGTRFVALTPVGRVEITLPLLGRPNVYNALAALATGLSLGLRLDEMARGIEACPQIPGRFERVCVPGQEDEQPFLVVVDYAHTEDALKNLLETARELLPRRVITVFGCGGDRDRSKRAPMGEVAGALSDFVIVTSDNPRSEDPEAIIEEIEAGLRRTDTPYLKIPDRRDAIFRAIEEAQPGDIVLLAGKGHETYQVFKDRTIPFDDRDVAREALIQKHESRGQGSASRMRLLVPGR